MKETREFMVWSMKQDREGMKLVTQGKMLLEYGPE
jgi:hypothetical protein